MDLINVLDMKKLSFSILLVVWLFFMTQKKITKQRMLDFFFVEVKPQDLWHIALAWLVAGLMFTAMMLAITVIAIKFKL